MDFSEKEIAKFIDIIVKNNIKFEFDKSEDFLNCISELTNQFEKKSNLNKFNNTCLLKLEEYSFTGNTKRISTGYGYPCRFYDYCPIDNVIDCINITNKIFGNIGIEECVFDFMSEYGIMYSGDGSKKIYEGLYLWPNQTLLDKTSKEQREHFLQYLFIDQTHINFLIDTDNPIRFNYIGFDKRNMIVKYAIKMMNRDFFVKNPSFHYNEYREMDKVIQHLKNIRSEENISMQLVPGKSESIAFETVISTQNYHSEIKQLISDKILEKSQAEKALSMSVEKYHHTIFKYKWDDKDKLEVKFYLVEDCWGI